MSARSVLARRCALVAVLLAAGLSTPAASFAAAPSEHLLVKFRSGVASGAVEHAIETAGGRELRTIPDIGVHVVSVPAASAAHALAALKARGDVSFAEPDGVAKPMESVPSNPYFPQSQGNALSLGGGAWGWYQTHTTQAWDLTRGSSSVVIAVLDSGLKPQGLNFGNQVVPGWNVLNGTSDTATNAGNHGTYVAGVAVEVADNSTGNAGYCPGCSIMPVQVGTDSGFLYSNLATGIDWAADHGAQIINMSLAGTSSSSAVASAVSYAQSKGVVLFAAAGNSNCNCMMYPAATPGVIGVAGVAQDGSKASDSNYGSWVALAAPEGDMTSWPSLNGAPGYAQVGGTSMASPAAAGIAGLLLSENPGLSGAQLAQALESSAAAVPFQVGYGELDAMAALRSLGYADPQAAVAPVDVAGPQILAGTDAYADNTIPLSNAPQVGQLLVRGQGSWTGSSPLSLSAVEWDRCNADGSGCSAVGSSPTYTVQSADSGYALRLKVTFTDPNGSTSAVSPLSAVIGGTPANSAPVNTAAPTISGSAQQGQNLSASTGTWSNSPSSYAYQWSRCDAAGANCVALSGATSSTYSLTSADVGDTLRVTVSAASSGGSASASSAATTAVQPSTQTLTFSGSLTTRTLSQSYSATVGAGVANASLSYKCSSNLTLTLKSGGTTVASVSGPSALTLSRSLAAGSYTYVVSGSSKCSFTLTVASPGP